MTAKLERARGTRDFSAGEALLRQRITGTLQEVFELYGYNPLVTPVLEKFDTLSSKYAGGAEILKETFKLKDQGDRELGLRYDLTVPMCRFIATNPNLKMPFKRYQIGPVFRDGPLKIGRYREFAQCDVDVVGVKSVQAEVELLKLTTDVFEQLDINPDIRINSRKILNAVIDILNEPQEKWNDIILSLDKLEKIGWKGIEEELKNKGLSRNTLTLLRTTLKNNTLESLRTYIEQVFVQQKKIFKSTEFEEGFNEIKEILDTLNELKVNNISFSPTLARGLSYYTGTVFEVFLKDSEITSSISAGGRYDRMIGNFVGSGREYPAVGISFGLDIIEDALSAKSGTKEATATAVYLIPIKAAEAARKIAAELRSKGVNTDIDLSGRDLKKNMEYAAAAGIPYVAFVGGKEKEGTLKLRDMKTGEEKTVTVAEAISILNRN